MLVLLSVRILNANAKDETFWSSRSFSTFGGLLLPLGLIISQKIDCDCNTAIGWAPAAL